MSKFFAPFTLLLLIAGLARAGDKFELLDGDRIALVGDTLIEREQESGWLETEMAADFPDRRFIVRNLGWSADTPAGISRASFDFADPNKTFNLLATEISQTKPTVVVLGYGMASSFSGQAGLTQFKSDLGRLIDKIQAGATNQIRFVLLGPIRHQKLAPPWPDPASHNQQIALYTKALRQIATRRGFPFVDLFDWKPALRGRELTDDGVHLTTGGYRSMAAEVARQLGWPERLAHARASVIDALRQTVVRKDELFFDRWRPQNDTYLFGFRKYEQGKNAREIPEFDPLVDAQDKRIAQLQALLLSGAKGPLAAEEAARPPEYPFTRQPLPDFTVAPGFEVNLWAENPLLAKPIQMNFDPQGRLWVATSSVYPQILPGQTANDKIVVLEDTNGSGKANKSTVFADGLFIPQGVEPGDGGCYVGQSTELLHFEGEPGHGKPKRRVVLSGFGTEDSHHMVHTLTWGPDGMLYFNQSIYIHSHIETPNGVVRLNSGGVFHLRPSTMQLDVFLRGFCNPWGHQFDAFGQSFVTDGAGYQGLSWGIPGAEYSTYAEMRRELPSVSPGQYPKFCGLEIVASRQFPDDWQGDFVTADFRAHRVVRFSITDDGAGYVTKEMPDVLTSTNVTFRPVDLKFGPDGALYVADWANPIINHGEVDFRDPRRDHEHGRIWRITARGRPLLPRVDLTRLHNDQLFTELLSSNAYYVQQARRVLTERGRKIEGALRRWTARQTDPYALLQALWVYQAIGERNDALLDKVLQAPDGRIRAAAARVLGYWPRKSLDAYAQALNDPFPRVRLEAVRALGLAPTFDSAALAFTTLQHPTDAFLDYALWLTVNQLSKPFLAGLQEGTWDITKHEKELAFTLDALDPSVAGPLLGEILQKQPLLGDAAGPWLKFIGRIGLPADVDRLYTRLRAGDFDSAAVPHVLASLHEAAGRGVKPNSDLDKVSAFFSASGSQTRLEAIRLAGEWGGPGKSTALIASLTDNAATETSVRVAGIEALRKIGGTPALGALRPLAVAGNPARVRQPAVLALAALDTAHCGSNAVAFLSDLTNSDAALSLWRSLLGNAGAGPVLAAALPRSGFPKAIGQAGVRAVRESGRDEPELVVALNRAAGLQGAEMALTAAEQKKLGEEALKLGNAARGERIFRRAQQSCTSCHSIGGVGGKVGPDLTSIGASSPIDYLVESVLYPNKQVKDGFQAYLVRTSDDEEITGIPEHETASELVLRTAGDQDVTVQKSQIKGKKAIGSLMPSGLIDSLGNQEQLDLFRFLSELGRPGPFDAARGNVARLWKVSLDPAQTAAEQKLLESPLTGEPWHRVMSLVNGSLLGADVIKAAAGGGGILAGTRFRSVKPGPVRFDLSAPPGTLAWIDGKPVPSNTAVLANVAPGVHQIVVKLNRNKMPEAISLRSDDGTFLGN